jgi:hypothetical protein
MYKDGKENKKLAKNYSKYVYQFPGTSGYRGTQLDY